MYKCEMYNLKKIMENKLSPVTSSLFLLLLLLFDFDLYEGITCNKRKISIPLSLFLFHSRNDFQCLDLDLGSRDSRLGYNNDY